MTLRSKGDERAELLQGTLDMLVLRTLLFGPQHGHGIVQSIRRGSEDTILVDAGSLYPALHRLVRRGWISAAWGSTENKRRAKFYRLTETGREQLRAEISNWGRLVKAIAHVMNPVREEG
jgi:transcriptional regulator